MTKRKAIPLRDVPCKSCPYRKDTPPGVWAPEEYRKLVQWDDVTNITAGVFLCHHSRLGKRNMACRGWFEVHNQNLGVRLSVICGVVTIKNQAIPNVPLYKSGAEACAAGLKGVSRAGKAAKECIRKLRQAKSRVEDGDPRER